MPYNNELQNRVYNLAKPLDLNALQNQYLIQKDKIAHPKTFEDLNQDLAIFHVIVDLLEERGVKVENKPTMAQVTT
ncbi:hypothetical protein [Candidatus Bathycorpusculum sp.]|uniref:hypothetical protein n=1 Tax=Candidatus Bathycorpusculum sp. TaxID=2994959 RepID=UPI0028178507|nr:hypothetical protein [Candidatus Termitimicrobium sp.]